MSKGRVLVVDDDADVRKLVCLTLTKVGYDVVEAEDGEKGIQALQTGDNPLKLDVIICDLMMPKVGGWEAITYFRSHFPSIPVIVMTSKDDVESVLTSFELGTVNYLLKPVQPDMVKAAVVKAIGERTK
ncbi:MAG TPA: response regulator [Nitrospiraceae bacterium]|nr:response regulator [Nitrospiraceae bacterium]